MRSNKGVSMITLIITIVVIIILAAIAIVSSGDAIGGSQFARFEQEFGDYAVNFEVNTAADIKEKNAVAGNLLTVAQINYEAATGVAAQAGHIVPAGEEFNNLAIALTATFPDQQLLELEETDEEGNVIKKSTQCYAVKDSNIKGYNDNHKFYGGNLGEEKHYVTQDGKVFTVPGYPRVVDGENRMYVTTELYYITDENYSDIAHNSTSEPGSGIIANNGGNLGEIPGGETPGGENPGEEGDEDDNKGDELFASIGIGEYVDYIPNTPTSVQWRVWSVNGNKIEIVPTSAIGELQLGVEDNNNTPSAEKLARAEIDFPAAISKIEALCDTYASSTLGVTAADIRSLKMSDIEDETVSDLKTRRDKDFSYSVVKYGETAPAYTSGSYFLMKYNPDTRKNEVSSTYMEATQEQPITVMQTYYNSTAKGPGWKNLPGSTTETYGTLIGDQTAWLADLAVDCRSNHARQSVCVIKSGTVSFYNLVHSNGSAWGYPHGVYPIITIDGSKITVNTENPGDGSTSTPWDVVKK